MPLEDCVDESTEYSLHCSNCGVSTEYNESVGHVVRWAENHGWMEINGDVYCADCVPTEDEEEPEPPPPPRRRGSISYRDCITVKD